MGFFVYPVIPAVEVLALADLNTNIIGTTSLTVFTGSEVTIPAGVLTSGRLLRITAVITTSVQGGVGSVLALRLGSTSVGTATSVTNANDKRLLAVIQGLSISSQFSQSALEVITGASVGANGGSILSTSVDCSSNVVLDLALTPGAVTDNWTCRTWLVELIQV